MKASLPKNIIDREHILFSYLGSFIGIAILAYLSIYSSYPLIAAPFGATAVLVFGVPDSPLAQPRNVIGGNAIGAIVCVFLVHFLGTEPWVMGLAVATAIKIMQLTRTVHPPGGAVALSDAPKLCNILMICVWINVKNVGTPPQEI